MKLIMDEKLKHRIVGISVILSLGAIFLPAMMKKSSQRMESNLSVKVQLPPKPTAPKVAVTDEEHLFKTIKVAKAQILHSPQEHSNVTQKDSGVPKANQATLEETKSKLTEKPRELALLNEAVQDAAKNSINTELAKASSQTAIAIAKTNVVLPLASKPELNKSIYAVQLASFTQLTNAQALVKKLEEKGYKAGYTRVVGKKAAIYKVFTGYSSDKEEVIKLKTQLAGTMQLNGFVVKTGVS
jgi:DedD protein